jgi:hypothetical protein
MAVKWVETLARRKVVLWAVQMAVLKVDSMAD